MKKTILRTSAAVLPLLCSGAMPSLLWAQSTSMIDRTVLPVPAPPFAGTIGMTQSESAPAFPARVAAPRGAPNILLVMTDDVGFAASSSFGGLVPTPALDRLAAHGLRYNNFHTTALCSATRAALLTGRNHHAVATGALTDIAVGYPGYSARIPKSAASVGEVLRQNGFSTAFFGKHHNVPKPETSSVGPFDYWPTGLGFEYFFGFVAAESDQWTPGLVRGTSRVDVEKNAPLDKLLVDDAIGWIHNQKAVTPEKPFFIYLAPGSTHAPHQAPKKWIDRFRGKFDMGWDQYREQAFKRQKAEGVIPATAVLTPRPDFLPAWASLSAEKQRIAARLMEVYAAQLAYQDHEFGRLMGELERMGEIDNTLVIFVEGDNGASSEGGVGGTSNELATLAGLDMASDEWLGSRMQQFGGPDSHNHYPSGWAWAMNTPFQLFKRYASHLGGIRNGMVLSWPARVQADKKTRPQFSHVIDIYPTILEAAGVPAPMSVNGTRQQPINGTSLFPTFAAASAPSPHGVQYFEMLGNRAIFQDGWFASTVPPEPTSTSLSKDGKAPGVLDYRWKLYDLNKDFSQSSDLAVRYPEKLDAMQKLWLNEAKANSVLPISNAVSVDRVYADENANHAQRKTFVYWGNEISIPYGAAPALNRRSFTMDADIELGPNNRSGTVLAYGDKFGGFSLFLRDGVLSFHQAATERPSDQTGMKSPAPLPYGPHKLQLSIRYRQGERPVVVMGIDGQQVAESSLPRPVAMLDLTEGLDIGHDSGLTVTSDYTGPNRLEGLQKVVINLPPE